MFLVMHLSLHVFNIPINNSDSEKKKKKHLRHARSFISLASLCVQTDFNISFDNT